MSERDRPLFLPPEEPSREPPEEPFPLLPGLDGPYGGNDEEGEPASVRRRTPLTRRDRAALVVIAVSAAGALLLGGLLLVHSGTDTPSLASGGTPVPPGLPVSPEYAALPNPCTAIGPALPKDVQAVRPHRFEDSCTWQLLRTDRSRSLDVDMQLERTDLELGSSGSVEAARDFADDLAYAGDGSRNGGFEHDPERLDGLGDEAFAAPASNLVLAGRTERTARSYDMGGAQVEVRRRNVVVTVKWRGADYPPAVRGTRHLAGRRFAYPDARRQAIVVANALLGALR